MAAHMIEALMYDHELRHERSARDHEWQDRKVKQQSTTISTDTGLALRPSHLETADMRMTWTRRNNIDVVLLLPILMPAVLLALWLQG